MLRKPWPIFIILLLITTGALWYAGRVQLELDRLQGDLHVSRTLVKALDGDTIELDGGEKVRVIGIDTGETWEKTESGGWRRIEPPDPRAVAASEFTRSFEGAKVRITYEETRKDRYGRTLAHVWVIGITPDGKPGNGFDLASELLRRGLAKVMMIPPNTARLKSYKAIAARFKKLQLAVAHEPD